MQLDKKNYPINNRIISLDIIRSIAIFCVVGVHFFLFSGFYTSLEDNNSFLFLHILRAFFIIGVQLFLLLSGYLLNKKVLNKKYFNKLWYLLGIYLIINIFTAIVNTFILHIDFSLPTFFIKVLNFHYIGYAWFIEMYLGLFLLIPFINIILNNINAKSKIFLITILIMLTFLPTVKHAFIDYWQNLYPITLYCIGAYLNEFKLKIPIRTNIFYLISSIVIFGIINYRYNNVFGDVYKNLITASEGIQASIVAILIFSLFLNLNYLKLNQFFQNIFYHISKYSYGMYLCSFIIDRVIYKQFNNFFNDFADKVPYLLIVVSIIFSISYVVSFLMTNLYYLIETNIKLYRKSKVD